MGDYRRVPCPICAKGPADRTCLVFDSGRVFCHRCYAAHGSKPLGPAARRMRPSDVDTHWQPIKDALAGQLEQTADPRPSSKVVHTFLSDWGRQVWKSCRPIESIARDYLEARNCVIPPTDGDLRWHPELEFKGTGHVGPALVALVTDFVTGQAKTLHRTWICADGTKDGPGRMFLGSHRKKGGVIRLWPDEAVTDGLALAEGLEDALSVAHVATPVWSALDAGNLAGLPVLPGIEALSVYADLDDTHAGEFAAWELVNRWRAAGREARVMVPTHGKDANDAIREVSDGSL